MIALVVLAAPIALFGIALLTGATMDIGPERPVVGVEDPDPAPSEVLPAAIGPLATDTHPAPLATPDEASLLRPSVLPRHPTEHVDQ